MTLTNKIVLFINVCVLVLLFIMIAATLAWSHGKYLECEHRGWTYLAGERVECNPTGRPYR